MKSNKKGFTLIELLAVIVILAIIALIATPIIVGVIDKARKGAAESSALGYIDAVEKQVMINHIDTTAAPFNLGAEYTYTEAGLSSYGVKVKGDQAKSGTYVVIGKSGEVKNAVIKINDYYVFYNTSKGATASKDSSLGDYSVIATDSAISSVVSA